MMKILKSREEKGNEKNKGTNKSKYIEKYKVNLGYRGAMQRLSLVELIALVGANEALPLPSWFKRTHR